MLKSRNQALGPSFSKRAQKITSGALPRASENKTVPISWFSGGREDSNKYVKQHMFKFASESKRSKEFKVEIDDMLRRRGCLSAAASESGGASAETTRTSPRKQKKGIAIDPRGRCRRPSTSISTATSRTELPA